MSNNPFDLSPMNIAQILPNYKPIDTNKLISDKPIISNNNSDSIDNLLKEKILANESNLDKVINTNDNMIVNKIHNDTNDDTHVYIVLFIFGLFFIILVAFYYFNKYNKSENDKIIVEEEQNNYWDKIKLMYDKTFNMVRSVFI